MDNAIFTQCELVVALGTIAVVGSLGFVKTNRNGLVVNFAVIFTGYVLLAISVLFLDELHISALIFMVMAGLASYFSYVPYGAGFYERKIAYLAIPNATSAFPSQIGSLTACSGTLIVFLVHSLGVKMEYLRFFRLYSYALAVLGAVTTLLGAAYFVVYKKKRNDSRARNDYEETVDIDDKVKPIN